MRPILILLAPLTLAACQNRDVVSICAAVGDPEVSMAAVAHDAEGALVRLSSDAATGQTSMSTQVLETPILPQVWQLGEHTVGATRESEANPCGEAVRSTVIITYEDGSTQIRNSSCSRNAVAIFAETIIDANAGDIPASEPEEQVLPEVILDPIEACARAS